MREPGFSNPFHVFGPPLLRKRSAPVKVVFEPGLQAFYDRVAGFVKTRWRF